ncbi:MAG: Fic family protein, partial [Chryseobacterium sp.]
MDEIIRALELKQQLDALRPIGKEQEDRIMQKFRLDWNYHSNNLEGNSLTYGETKALLMHGITAQGKPLKDHFEITGHNEAINWIVEIVNGDRPLTENFIRELHILLLKQPYEVDAVTPDGKPTKKIIKVGEYKTSPNHVQTKTGEIFYFATPEETAAEMADLMAWYREKTGDEKLNPILIAAEFHYKFIRIHPFDDGNGRTARILMNFILMKFGYPPVIVKTEDKANYFAALQLADAGNIEAFIEYVARNLNRSLEIMIAGANGESVEEPDDIDKEIALLEKRLSGVGEKELRTRSISEIEKIYENSIR